MKFISHKLDKILALLLIVTVLSGIFNSSAHSKSFFGVPCAGNSGIHLSGEEAKHCTHSIVAMATAGGVAAVHFGGPIAGAVAAGLAAGIDALTRGLLLKSIYEETHICNHDSLAHPYPLSDAEIRKIMSDAGQKITEKAVAENRSKLCVKRGSNVLWIQNGKCSSGQICAYKPSDTSEMLCGRILTSCMYCIPNIDNGHHKEPDYEKETTSSGVKVIKTQNGAPVIKNQKDYFDRLYKHCKIPNTSTINTSILSNMSSIIDETCRDSIGASKNTRYQFLHNAKIVQCIENTIRNIFEKPLTVNYSSDNVFSATPKQTLAIADYRQDMITLQDIRDRIVKSANKLKEILDSMNSTSSTLGYSYKTMALPVKQIKSTNFDVSRIKLDMVDGIERILKRGDEYTSMTYADKIDKIHDLDNEDHFLHKFATGGEKFIEKDYKNNEQGAKAALKTHLKDLMNDAWNSAQYINSLITQIYETKVKPIVNVNVNDVKNKYKSGKLVKLTMFQGFQGKIKIVFSLLMILYVTMLGIKIILGEQKLSMKEIIQLGIKITMVSYFAIGNAWKDYFFDLILNTSHGLSEFFMEVGKSNVVQRPHCSFSGSDYYFRYSKQSGEFVLLRSGDECPGNVAKTAVRAGGLISASGSDIFSCKRVNPIPTPNYRRPYLPVYYIHESTGLFCKRLNGKIDRCRIAVFCSNGNEAEESEDLFGRKVLVCPENAYLEEGYRMQSLTDVGFKEEDLLARELSSGGNNVIKTAVQRLDDNRMEVDLSFPSQMVEMVVRNSRVIALESIRNDYNKNYARYSGLAANGVPREMGYIAAFDRIDCEIDYLFSQIRVGVILQLVFTHMPLGIIIAACVLLLMLVVIFMMLKAVQTYLVAVIGMVLLAYLSPVMIPTILFGSIKKVFDTWLSELQKYVTGTPIIFFTMIITVRMINYIFYGAEGKYFSENMFTPTGDVNSSCYALNRRDAPFMCLISTMTTSSRHVPIIGSLVAINDSEIIFLLTRTFMTVVMAYITIDFVDKIEDTLNQLAGAADTSLKQGMGKAGASAKGAVATVGSMGKAAAGAAYQASRAAYQGASKKVAEKKFGGAPPSDPQEKQKKRDDVSSVNNPPPDKSQNNPDQVSPIEQQQSGGGAQSGGDDVSSVGGGQQSGGGDDVSSVGGGGGADGAV